MGKDRQKMKNSGSGFLCLMILKLSILERPAYHKSIEERKTFKRKRKKDKGKARCGSKKRKKNQIEPAAVLGRRIGPGCIVLAKAEETGGRDQKPRRKA